MFGTLKLCPENYTKVTIIIIIIIIIIVNIDWYVWAKNTRQWICYLMVQ